jgi:hypothetical protein
MLTRNCIYQYEIHNLITEADKDCARMVVTDPPYDRDSIGLYCSAAALAAKVLIPGGWFFALGGVSYLPEQLEAIRSVGALQYFAVFMLDHRGGYPRIWSRRLLSAYKPVYVFTKGRFPIDTPWQATALGGEKDKRFHAWGQGERPFYKWIDMLSEPGDLIVDPFCGGGTVCSVAKQLGRDYIGADISQEAVDESIARLEQVSYQPRLQHLFSDAVNVTMPLWDPLLEPLQEDDVEEE